ncbi:2'-5' RNA ligase family protein [Nocardioides acrostichi]|uniref:2'-5' RNA ligase family protein n=1 Tax=Nocardioides acrostichi TaxID=2784339 RepID=A0A930YAU3_9ACTN|nr:2'-5' RNA ligase family protein [Nocardioides acrostichi]MBF4161753.1 2'-5' RNA ligase family protein [Nocardioides acrostichi]
MPTIGVAVAVPDPWGSSLQEYRERLGDPSAGLIPTHITLLPPTQIDDAVIEDVANHLGRAAASSARFRIRLRGTATFRPVSPVVFVALAEGIGGCEQLAEQVRCGPLDVDLAYPYHPHVTVAHDLPDADLDRAFDELSDFDCAFEVDGFHLYVHDVSDGWRATHGFPLTRKGT